MEYEGQNTQGEYGERRGPRSGDYGPRWAEGGPQIPWPEMRRRMREAFREGFRPGDPEYLLPARKGEAGVLYAVLLL